MRTVARRLVTLLSAIIVGMLLGALVGGWGESMIFGGIGGAVLGMLYDPRASTYTVPTRGGGTYPGDRDD
jgi:hypothetical protein